MKTLFLIAALLIAPVLAEAQTHTFTLSIQMVNVAADGSNRPTAVKIERKLGTTGTYAQIGQAAAVLPTTTYQDAISNPSPGGMQYCYRVRASNVVGDSPYSVEACGTTAVIAPTVVPNVPGFTVSAISKSVIELSWAAVPDVTGYQFDRSRAATPQTIEKTVNVAATATSIRDTNLVSARSYCYAMRAFNSADASNSTPLQCATTLR